ncbi:hypothetical protein [Rhodococcus jostii]|nr:hypothetical protein [Rhodococcus jostii]
MLVAPLHFTIVVTRELLDTDLPTRLADPLLQGLITPPPGTHHEQAP